MAGFGESKKVQQKASEGLPGPGIHQDRAEGLKKVQCLRSEIVQRPGHLEQHQCWHGHPPSDHFLTKLLRDRILSFRGLKGGGILDGKGMP